MSPRRRVMPEVVPEPVPKRDWRAELRRGWRLPALCIATSLLVIVAITATSIMLWRHVSDRRHEVADAAVLGYVGQFMTEYTTLDPYNANAYTDRILTGITGDFAKEFKEKQNAILISVAQGEPTKGTVIDAGIEKRYDDGSVSVLVATKINTTAGNPPQPIESGNRWVVTAVEEGQQWKISRLTEVI